jgi:hypothetical protein
MIGGVNFQPGVGTDPQSQSKPTSGSGVQEAIKVLSLRLPKVVGAQAAAPQALLQGTGAGGNRIDSVVNQVLARLMPTGQPSQQPMAQVPSIGAPSFTGDAQQSQQAPAMPSWPWGGQQQPQQPPKWQPPAGFNPRVSVDNPMGGGDFTLGADGRPTGGQPPSMIGELPQGYQPPQPDFDLIGRLLGGWGGGGGSEPPRDQELF